MARLFDLETHNDPDERVSIASIYKRFAIPDALMPGSACAMIMNRTAAWFPWLGSVAPTDVRLLRTQRANRHMAAVLAAVGRRMTVAIAEESKGGDRDGDGGVDWVVPLVPDFEPAPEEVTPLPVGEEATLAAALADMSKDGALDAAKVREQRWATWARFGITYNPEYVHSHTDRALYLANLFPSAVEQSAVVRFVAGITLFLHAHDAATPALSWVLEQTGVMRTRHESIGDVGPDEDDLALQRHYVVAGNGSVQTQVSDAIRELAAVLLAAGGIVGGGSINRKEPKKHTELIAIGSMCMAGPVGAKQGAHTADAVDGKNDSGGPYIALRWDALSALLHARDEHYRGLETERVFVRVALRALLSAHSASGPVPPRPNA